MFLIGRHQQVLSSKINKHPKEQEIEHTSAVSSKIKEKKSKINFVVVSITHGNE
jgi:hypothetical protein